jgi:hypothetical protein
VLSEPPSSAYLERIGASNLGMDCYLWDGGLRHGA